jgi:hypothetical protein
LAEALAPVGNADYSLSKIGAAVQTLATHPGRVRERLKAALADFARSNREAMPTDETRRYWDRIWAAYTAGQDPPLKGSGSIAIDSLTEDEAVLVAQDICSLEALLESALGR